MKRLMTLLLAAGLVLGATSAAKAVDFKMTGLWQNRVSFADRNFEKHNGDDKMRAAKGVPSTAAITPIQFCEKYCQYVDEGYTDVIHVPINKSGSSTYNNALMAQGMLREERPEHH